MLSGSTSRSVILAIEEPWLRALEMEEQRRDEETVVGHRGNLYLSVRAQANETLEEVGKRFDW
jgi:hypothetical protein